MSGTDPRKAGGSIAGPGGPHEKNSVIIDTTNAVLLDGVNVALVELRREGRGDGKPVCALSLAGRINKTQDYAEIVYLMDSDGVAGIVSELLALINRAGFGDQLSEDLEQRLNTLHSEGNL